MKIDGERLLEWITTQEASLRAAQEDLAAEDGVGFQRIVGAITSLKKIREQLPSMSERRKPIREISVPTKHKLRRNDPSTSFSAALSQSPEKSRGLYMAIHAILERKALTDEELVGIFEEAGKEVTPSGVRSRRAELTDAGWLRDSGQKRDTKSGHPSIVWEAVPSVI